MNFTNHELSLAVKLGKRAAFKWSSVEADDVVSQLNLWLCEHYDTVVRWRDEEHGEAKLFVSLRREAARFCAKEQEAVIGRPLRQDNFYTVDLLERAMPYIFEEIPQTVVAENPVSGATAAVGSPSDFGNAVVIISEIRGSFHGLAREVRTVLEYRFRDGLTFEQIGELLGMSKVGAKKRVDRALSRLSDSLSGVRA